MCGLATASMLVKAGVECTLVEAGSRPGGRLHSFLDHASGRTLDNGQHVLVDACQETLDWLGEIGVADFPFDRVTSIPFRSTTGRQGVLTTMHSLSLFTGLLGFGLLPISDRLQTILHFVQLRRVHASSLRTALDGFGASGESMRYVWEPLCRAFFSRDLEEVDVVDFSRLLDEFVRRPTLLMPTKSLEDTFIRPAMTFLTRNRVRIRYGSRVRKWVVQNGFVRRILLSSENDIRCDIVVSTIPPRCLAEIDVNPMESRSSAIVSVYFWCDHLEAPPVTALVDSAGQWLFNKGGGLYQVTISRADRWLDLANEELMALLVQELNQCGIAVPHGVRYRVIRTRQAIYHGVGACASYANLHVGGDWTNTGLPGSIESAVRSARQITKNILQGDIEC